MERLKQRRNKLRLRKKILAYKLKLNVKDGKQFFYSPYFTKKQGGKQGKSKFRAFKKYNS